MAEMGRLPANCLPTMAVGASNFAVLDLRSEVLDRVLVERERHDAPPSLWPDVIEFQDHHVGLAAADTRSVGKMVQQVTEVAPLERPVDRDAFLEVHTPRSSGAPVGASTMTARADDFAARDLGLDPCEGVPLVDEDRDVGGLVSHVIELQDDRIRQSAVHTAGCSQQPQHVASRVGPSQLPRRAHLLDVQGSALADVRGPAPPTGALAFVKLDHRQVRAAAPAALRLDRLRGGQRGRGRRSWRCDAAGPHAHGAERDTEGAGDRTQRHSFRAEAPRLSLGGDLSTSHTNICSRKRRTF
jgi:hypothetical protein